MHGLKASPVFPQGPWSQGMCREIKPRPEALPNVCGGFKSLLRFINVFIKTDMFSAYRCMPGTVLRAGVRWSALDMEPLSWWSVGKRVRGKPLVSFSQKTYLQMLVSAKVYCTMGKFI